jgi:hypothetical protein
MRRLSLWITCLGLFLALGAPLPNAWARTSVSIGLSIGDRYRGPDLYFHNEPRVILVPRTRVYYIADYDYDIYRYGRFWYYNYDGAWYRSRSYRGPWIFVGYRSVPQEISYVPRRYRRHWSNFSYDARYTTQRDRTWRDRDRRDNDRYDRDRDNRTRDRDRDRDRDRWRDRNRGDGY